MLEELKTLVAVVELQSFTRAGESIGLSQPSVSLHIKHLEHHFKTVLVQRSVKQKKINITPQGRMLYEKAKIIFNLLSEAEEELSAYENQVSGSLHLGCSFTIGEYFVPHFLGIFREKYPDVELHISIGNTSSICKKVESYEIDLGLVEGTVERQKLDCSGFYEDSLMLAVSKKNPLSTMNFDSCKRCFEDQMWIGRESGSGTKEHFDFFLSSNKIAPKKIIVFESNFAIKEAVKHNIGITFISSLVLESELQSGEIVAIPTPDSYTRSFSYVLPKNSRPSKLASVFIEMLKEYSQDKKRPLL